MFRIIRKAHGKYIILLGDDDIIMQNALGEIENVLSKYNTKNIGVILSSCRVFDNLNKRELISKEYFNDDKFLPSGKESLLWLFFYAYRLSGIVIKRDLINIIAAQRYIGSLYPQMLFVGKALKISSGAYINKHLIKKRINTKKYWDYLTILWLKLLLK